MSNMEDRYSASNSLASELSRLNVDRVLDYTPYVEKLNRQNINAIRRQFKQGLERHRTCCEVTGMGYGCIASHIKPLAMCRTEEECVDPANGLYLCKTLDELFDKGWITFEENGVMNVSTSFEREYGKDELRARIPRSWISGEQTLTPPDCEKMAKRRQIYMRYHRYNVFRESYRIYVDDDATTAAEEYNRKKEASRFYDDKNPHSEKTIRWYESWNNRMGRDIARAYRKERKERTGIVFVSEEKVE